MEISVNDRQKYRENLVALLDEWDADPITRDKAKEKGLLEYFQETETVWR